MKESRLFIKFIKSYASLFLIFLFFGGLLGYLYSQQITPTYISEELMQIRPLAGLNTAEINESLILSDHLITLARSANLAISLGLKGVEVSSVRFSNYGIKISTSSKNYLLAKEGLTNLDKFLSAKFTEFNPYQKYSLTQQGEVFNHTQSPNFILYISCGILAGLSLAFLTALTRSYFHSY